MKLEACFFHWSCFWCWIYVKVVLELHLSQNYVHSSTITNRFQIKLMTHMLKENGILWGFMAPTAKNLYKSVYTFKHICDFKPAESCFSCVRALLYLRISYFWSSDTQPLRVSEINGVYCTRKLNKIKIFSNERRNVRSAALADTNGKIWITNLIQFIFFNEIQNTDRTLDSEHLTVL